jgi:hypothetical protein
MVTKANIYIFLIILNFMENQNIPQKSLPTQSNSPSLATIYGSIALIGTTALGYLYFRSTGSDYHDPVWTGIGTLTILGGLAAITDRILFRSNRPNQNPSTDDNPLEVLTTQLTDNVMASLIPNTSTIRQIREPAYSNPIDFD